MIEKIICPGLNRDLNKGDSKKATTLIRFDEEENVKGIMCLQYNSENGNCDLRENCEKEKYRKCFYSSWKYAKG